MQITAKIEGLDQAVKALDQLPEKWQRNALLNMLRRSTRPMIRAARSRLLSHGSNYKKLSQSIGNITAKSKNAIIYVGPRVKGKWRFVGYIAHWVEYGTKGVKTSRGGRAKNERDRDFAPIVARVPLGGKYRDDQPAKPFMRPAIDNTKNQVADNVVDVFNKFLDKKVKQLIAKIK